MAARSYLTEQENQECLELWKKQKPGLVADYLQNKVTEKLAKLPAYNQLQIFGMGSLARKELCPQSDIDLLIIGKSEDIKKFMQGSFEVGLKIRARTFESPDDIFEGAEVFDILSMSQLFIFPTLENQKHSDHTAIAARVALKIKKERGQILRTLKQEKKDRQSRFDSLVNYLEPNLKLGSGGIRDIQQSLYLYEVFPERFSGELKNKKLLLKFKKELLNIRQGAHLLGFNDSLVAQAQLDLHKLLNYKEISQLMTVVEKLFSESAFYANWVLAKVKMGRSQKIKISSVGVTLKDLKRILAKDTSEITQEELRSHRLATKFSANPSKDIQGLLNVNMSESTLMAIFGSKMMHRLFADLKKVEGLVQHDQYHLLTVDAHLKHAMRLVIRAKKSSAYLGPKMKAMAKSFNKNDWEILFWSAFFHDLAKGRKGDHSTVGSRLCKSVLGRYGFKKAIIDEIAWIVKNHLIFSVAAFRRNPKSPKTLHWLLQSGVKGQRAKRLAYFTAIDIYATNSTAWNEWKEKLIVELHDELQSGRAKKLERFLLGLSRGVLTQNLEIYSQLDTRLQADLPAKALKEDINKMQTTKTSLEPLVIPAGSSRYWIRFHDIQDKDGLFLRYVSSLHAAGLSVTEAFVQTFAEYGVYDWFLVKGSRKQDTIKKVLKATLANDQLPSLSTAHFEKVEVIPQDEGTAIISFRGIDQKGALLTAAASVFAAKLPIIWAKIVTWGRRIDDVFCVKATEESLSHYQKEHIPKLTKQKVSAT